MPNKPSRRVLALFAEVEQIAEQMLQLKVEAQRLGDILERVWQARTIAMATLALKAHFASEVEVAECVARHAPRGKKRPRRPGTRR